MPGFGGLGVLGFRGFRVFRVQGFRGQGLGFSARFRAAGASGLCSKRLQCLGLRPKRRASKRPQGSELSV